MIPVILGPTASGKTEIGIAICLRLNGEIVSADSRQIYRKMDIGSAKPTPAQQSLVKHHLIDILDPDQSFSAGDFVRCALEAIADIQSRGKLPVIVGGATLYLRALTQGIFSGRSSDPELRSSLLQRYGSGEAQSLCEEMTLLDPAYAAKVHLNDGKKIVRFFEIYHSTGLTVSQLKSHQSGGYIDSIIIGIQLNRAELYTRIDQRVDRMIESGLLQEVQGLRDAGYHKDLNSMNSPGYREIFDFLEGKITWDKAVELIKQGTRRYAKRQITWFKKDPAVWFQPNHIDDIIAHICSRL